MKNRAPLNGKYVHVDGPADADYLPEGKMLFPRMWSSASPSHIDFYETYMDGKGIRVKGATHKKPTFGANLRFFFDYQLNWMYWRYFMWNFVGRQNEIHSPSPGELFYGNWESGIAPIDRFRLGDQRDAPAVLKENKARSTACCSTPPEWTKATTSAAASPRRMAGVPDVLHDGHRHRPLPQSAADAGPRT